MSGESVSFGFVVGVAEYLSVGEVGWSSSTPRDQVVGLQPRGRCVASWLLASASGQDQKQLLEVWWEGPHTASEVEDLGVGTEYEPSDLG